MLDSVKKASLLEANKKQFVTQAVSYLVGKKVGNVLLEPKTIFNGFLNINKNVDKERKLFLNCRDYIQELSHEITEDPNSVEAAFKKYQEYIALKNIENSKGDTNVWTSSS